MLFFAFLGVIFFKKNVPLNTPMYPYVPTANSGCRNFAL